MVFFPTEVMRNRDFWKCSCWSQHGDPTEGQSTWKLHHMEFLPCFFLEDTVRDFEIQSGKLGGDGLVDSHTFQPQIIIFPLAEVMISYWEKKMMGNTLCVSVCVSLCVSVSVCVCVCIYQWMANRLKSIFTGWLFWSLADDEHLVWTLPSQKTNSCLCNCIFQSKANRKVDKKNASVILTHEMFFMPEGLNKVQTVRINKYPFLSGYVNLHN